MLKPKIFDYVICQFGRPEIDMFASRLTKQIPIYASSLPDPESSFIDAFTINWNNISMPSHLLAKFGECFKKSRRNTRKQ